MNVRPFRVASSWLCTRWQLFLPASSMRQLCINFAVCFVGWPGVLHATPSRNRLCRHLRRIHLLPVTASVFLLDWPFLPFQVFPVASGSLNRASLRSGSCLAASCFCPRDRPACTPQKHQCMSYSAWYPRASGRSIGVAEARGRGSKVISKYIFEVADTIFFRES